MLSFVLLLVVASVTVGCSWFAMRHVRTTAMDVRCLVHGIEVRTREPGETGVDSPGAPRVAELDELLDDAISSDSHAAAVLAANEITSRADLARSSNRFLARGLARICALSGGAGAFLIAAAGSFEERSILLAAGSFGLGLLGSVSVQVALRRGRKVALQLGEVAETLAKQVRARFSEDVAG
jgi:hypothetical protein